MPVIRALPGLLLVALCGPALGEEIATEACLDLASHVFAADPQLQQRWQQTWLDSASVREEAYDGVVDGEHVSRRLSAQLRRGERLDGRFTCLLAESGKPLSVQYQAEAGTP